MDRVGGLYEELDGCIRVGTIRLVGDYLIPGCVFD